MPVDIPVMFNEELRGLLKIMASEGITHAARGFEGMIGIPLRVSEPQMRLVPLSDVPHLLGGPETEAVGIYLRAQGGIDWQMMLILDYAKAFELVELIIGEPRHPADGLGQLERSALGELGNLTGSFFLNAMAALSGLEARPSPPAVMVDMVGAILDVVVATYGGQIGRHVLMVQVAFVSENREVQADFWVIPDPAALEAFARKGALNDGH